MSVECLPGRGVILKKTVKKGHFIAEHEYKTAKVYPRSKHANWEREYAENNEGCMVLDVQTSQGGCAWMLPVGMTPLDAFFTTRVASMQHWSLSRHFSSTESGGWALLQHEILSQVKNLPVPTGWPAVATTQKEKGCCTSKSA